MNYPWIVQARLRSKCILQLHYQNNFVCSTSSKTLETQPAAGVFVATTFTCESSQTGSLEYRLLMHKQRDNSDCRDVGGYIYTHTH